MITTTRPRPTRPLPQRVEPATAPPVEASSTPWAALFAEPLEAGGFEWVMGPDGALMPVPLGAGARPVTAKRGWLAGRRRRSATIEV